MADSTYVPIIVDGGNLTIKGGYVYGSPKTEVLSTLGIGAIIVKNDGTVTIENSYVTGGSGADNGGSGISVWSTGGNVNIKGDTTITGGGNGGIGINGPAGTITLDTSGNKNIKLYGGLIGTKGGGWAVRGNVTVDGNGTVLIKGADETSTALAGGGVNGSLSVSGTATVEVNAGTPNIYAVKYAVIGNVTSTTGIIKASDDKKNYETIKSGEKTTKRMFL